MTLSYFATLCLLIILPFLLVPGVWKALIGGDDLDHDLHDINLVVLRNPVRESGPPVCMAKLIMLRHKINQGGQRRRKLHGHTRHVRSSSRIPIIPQRPRAVSWMRFGKQMH